MQGTVNAPDATPHGLPLSTGERAPPTPTTLLKEEADQAVREAVKGISHASSSPSKTSSPAMDASPHRVELLPLHPPVRRTVQCLGPAARFMQLFREEAECSHMIAEDARMLAEDAGRPRASSSATSTPELVAVPHCETPHPPATLSFARE